MFPSHVPMLLLSYLPPVQPDSHLRSHLLANEIPHWTLIAVMRQICLCDGSVSLILPLFFIALVITIIHDDLPQGTLPLCLKRLTHPLLEVGHSRRYLQDNGLYFFNSYLSLSSKEPGIQTQTRWLFWDISLLSLSASFPNRIIFLASIFWLIGLSSSEQTELGLSNTCTICLQ